MQSVTFPQLSVVTEGTILRWLKREGDPVKQDEPLAELETDKINIELQAPCSGIMLQIFAREGETVSVGADLALIGEGDDDVLPANPPFQLPSAPPRPAPKRGLLSRLFTHTKRQVRDHSLSTPLRIREKGSREVLVTQDHRQMPLPPEPAEGPAR